MNAVHKGVICAPSPTVSTALSSAFHPRYLMSPRGGGASGVDLDHVRQAAELFLATRAALETDREIVLDSPSSRWAENRVHPCQNTPKLSWLA